jgi:predicted amidophosphoribosyltransferase
MPEEYQQTCPACEKTLSLTARYCSRCGTRVRDRETFEKSDEYIRIEELHPACVLLPCRYEHCDNECWVCGTGSTKDFTVCSDCYDGPDVSKYFDNVTVRIGEVESQRL